mmetsp:Transcript_56850/g.115743  ORF Transcript_56850/g.115743 Transcript_56850/m.115743 type:complete len:98 (-) Transcript_56850:537-830(-)
MVVPHLAQYLCPYYAHIARSAVTNALNVSAKRFLHKSPGTAKAGNMISTMPTKRRVPAAKQLSAATAGPSIVVAAKAPTAIPSGVVKQNPTTAPHQE